MKKFSLYAATAVLFLAACSTSTEMEAHEYWARATQKGNNGAVYMILHNHAKVEDVLLGASTDAAEVVEIHLSSVDANGVMHMEMQETLPLAAGEEVEFKPGGYHFMLINVLRDLNAGDEIQFTLKFANRSDIVLTVPVKDAAEMNGGGMDMDDHQ